MTELLSAEQGVAPIEKGGLYYNQMGKGAPIVILHGGPGLTHNHFLPQMLPLAENHSVIVYDQRGSGRSSHSRIDKSLLTIKQFTADLDALRQHLKLDKITLMGHSWGSFLALAYAQDYPQHTEKLILVGPQPMCHKGMQEFEASFHKRLAALNIPQSDSAPSTPDELADYYRQLSAAFCYDPQKANELTLEYDLEADKKGRAVGHHLNQALFSGLWDYHTQLSEIKAPTLIIHGLQDPIPLWSAQKIQECLPNANLVTIDRCGHFPYIEQPEEFFKSIATFMAL